MTVIHIHGPRPTDRGVDYNQDIHSRDPQHTVPAIQETPPRARSPRRVSTQRPSSRAPPPPEKNTRSVQSFLWFRDPTKTDLSDRSTSTANSVVTIAPNPVQSLVVSWRLLRSAHRRSLRSPCHRELGLSVGPPSERREKGWGR